MKKEHEERAGRIEDLEGKIAKEKRTSQEYHDELEPLRRRVIRLEAQLSKFSEEHAETQERAKILK